MVKKIVVCYDCVDNTTEEIDISYILYSQINLSFSLLALREIINKMVENKNLDIPRRIFITLDVSLKKDRFFNSDEEQVERTIKKELYQPNIHNPRFHLSLVISDLMIFLNNITFYMDVLKNFDNMTRAGICFFSKNIE